MRKISACILALVLLASVVPLAITPVAAVYEKKIHVMPMEITN